MINKTVKIEQTQTRKRWQNGYYVTVDSEVLIDEETYVFSSNLELMEFIEDYLNMNDIIVSGIDED